MGATLMLVRHGFAIELRRGEFDALVDGEQVATLVAHDRIEVPIEPGRHTLRIEAGRYSSPARSFEAVDGETVTFQLHGANLWPVFVASLVKPDLAISLKRVNRPPA
ncbi:MAG TPA: hypothetical protein VJ914_07870 [Pseudonocardiaceae bacterium]|nr:hypothetical protein [Pseudonocardiaceae bacterium]